MPSLTRNEYDILVLAISWCVGFAPILWNAARGRPTMTWVQAIGLALVATPFARMLLGIYLSIGALFTFTVLEPVSQAALWSGVVSTILYDITFPIVGLLILRNAFPWIPSRRAPRQGIADALAGSGLAPRVSLARDLLRGLTLFFCIALAYLIALAISSQISAAVAGGDESQYWRNITLPLIVLVSSLAGVSEEILFRGVLLTRLARSMPFWLAATLQALFFGFIHAGYGTWTHVLAPFAFGLGMAWIARVLGLIPAILLHAQIDIIFFAIDVSGEVPSAWLLVIALGLLNIAAALLTRFDAIRLLWQSLMRTARAAL